VKVIAWLEGEAIAFLDSLQISADLLHRFLVASLWTVSEWSTLVDGELDPWTPIGGKIHKHPNH
jgi:hypothetical protein